MGMLAIQNVFTTHNPAGYTVINRNDDMIVQPHNTLAYFYSEDTSLMDMMKPFSTF